MSTDRERFWLTKFLAAMTPEEWESLCDGCARCCLYKVQYRDTGEVYYTNVACRFLDARRCRCTSYEQRTLLVPNYLVLTGCVDAEFGSEIGRGAGVVASFGVR